MKKRQICSALILTTLIWSFGMMAADPLAAFNHWFVSPTGNDADDCMTWLTTCKTIAAAVGKASSGDSIIVATGIYTESLVLNKDLTLIGSGSDATIISGGDTQRVMSVTSSIAVTVYDLAVMRGFADLGGGIVNNGTLTLTNSVVAENDGSSGGGIRNYGTLTLNHSTIADNRASGGGHRQFGHIDAEQQHHQWQSGF